MKYFLMILMLSSCQSHMINGNSNDELVNVGTGLNIYRESLSHGIDTTKPITKNVFKVTCMPVGKRIKKLKIKKGITVKQVSHKNRNQKNSVPSKFSSYYQEFVNTAKLDHKIINVENHKYALKRITVQESCLACHGSKESRPKFVKKKYSKDKAHSFKAGDLRGIYIISKD